MAPYPKNVIPTFTEKSLAGVPVGALILEIGTVV